MADMFNDSPGPFHGVLALIGSVLGLTVVVGVIVKILIWLQTGVVP